MTPSPLAVPRPPALFDREWEWQEVVRFATSDRAGPSLGIVSGRRRQGKSFLLSALTNAVDGMYHEAVEATSTEALRRLGETYRQAARLNVAPAFRGFEDAIEALVALPAGPRPPLVVLDEFPYLVEAEPSLPSLVAAALSPAAALRRPSSVRLLVCGSAQSLMGGLLATAAPLRGRAGLELVVAPFGFRDAAAFCGLDHDPAAALRVFAIVGGTPAYAREFVDFDTPDNLAELDDWVARAVLNPARPLFREGRILVAEEHALRDRALYHSVLAAIAAGDRTRGRIASRVGRPADALGHPLAVLTDAGLVVRQDDPFRGNRPLYLLTEPFLRFWHAVVRPRAHEIRAPLDAAAVWHSSQHTFAAQVLGPAFEEVCREWALRHADADLVGGPLAGAAAGIVTDPSTRRRHEIDVVGWTVRSDGGRRVSLLGEAKVGQLLTATHIGRLREARDAAVRAGHDAGSARLALFSGAGFSDDAVALARDGEAVLIDLARLYHS